MKLLHSTLSLVFLMSSLCFADLPKKDSEKEFAQKGTRTAFIDIDAVRSGDDEYRENQEALQSDLDTYRKSLMGYESELMQLQTKLNDKDLTESARRDTIEAINKINSKGQMEAANAQKVITMRGEELERDAIVRYKRVGGEVSRDQGFDAVQPAFIVNNKDIDITNTVLDRLNKKYELSKENRKRKAEASGKGTPAKQQRTEGSDKPSAPTKK